MKGSGENKDPGLTLWVKITSKDYSRLKEFFKKRPEIKKSYFYGEAIVDKLNEEEGQ